MRRPLDTILLEDLKLSRWLGRNKKKFVKHWAMTERGRDTLSDLIDRGYELNWPRPISGGARNFDGVDDNVARGGDDATLDVADSSSCALQMLVKLDAVSNVVRGIGGKKTGTANAAGYHFRMAANERTLFACSDGTDSVAPQDASAMVAGTWYSFTGILTANAAANDDVSLYKDLSLVAGPTNSTVLGSLETAQVFGVGGTSGGTANFWDGDISYCRFWKRVGAAWTARQITNLVELHNRLYIPQDEFMELQWILWETAASPATTTDYTDNGFDGTYTGTTFVEDPKRVQMAAGAPVYIVHQPQAAATPSLLPLSRQRAFAGLIVR